MKVGFIGLGIMGRPMCKNLLKAGYEVTAFDPFAKEALDDVVSCGAARGESNADVASKSDLVITMGGGDIYLLNELLKEPEERIAHESC